MKILVFHQPYPMGNYKLNQVIAEYFEKEGHEVYLLEQLNGRPANEDYIQQILNKVIYKTKNEIWFSI